jgi:hypothetical protein
MDGTFEGNNNSHDHLPAQFRTGNMTKTNLACRNNEPSIVSFHILLPLDWPPESRPERTGRETRPTKSSPHILTEMFQALACI